MQSNDFSKDEKGAIQYNKLTNSKIIGQKLLEPNSNSKVTISRAVACRLDCLETVVEKLYG